MLKDATHKAKMKARRAAQLARVPTFIKVPSGKYIPAGVLKNLKPHNK